jgi:hypothetical protein
MKRTTDVWTQYAVNQTLLRRTKLISPLLNRMVLRRSRTEKSRALGTTESSFAQQVPTGKIDHERWVCGSHRLYVLASHWNPGESEPKDLRRIVDSFRVITKK